jgi:hypothetical protein
VENIPQNEPEFIGKKMSGLDSAKFVAAEYDL